MPAPRGNIGSESGVVTPSNQSAGCQRMNGRFVAAKTAAAIAAAPQAFAPSVHRDDRDEIERREEPGQLFRRGRDAVRERAPSPLSPEPGGRERQDVQEVGAAVDGERRERRRAEDRGEHERPQADRRAQHHERHRGDEAQDVEAIGVPAERDERRDQQERQRGVGRPRHELDVRPVSLPERPRRVELIVRRIHDHVGELVRAGAASCDPRRCRAARSSRRCSSDAYGSRPWSTRRAAHSLSAIASL